MSNSWFFLLFVTFHVYGQYPPEQIHIAVGWTPDRMVFNWITFDDPAVTWSRVDISENPNVPRDSETITVFGKEYEFVDPWDKSEIVRTVHVTVVPDLKASTRYYYKVGDIYYGQSEIYSFKTGVNAETLSDNLPIKYIIYGDLGVYYLSDAVDKITAEINDGNVDTVIHVGDIAYDMYENDGRVGDEFMNMVQPIATQVPYLVCPGNHEKYENFSHYTERYRGQPSNTGTVWTGSGEAPNNWYYSWNEGLVHWIAISTEIYFNYPWMIEDQYIWLEQDLKTANLNRTEAPWVIVYGHKQIYCSDPYNDREGGSAETLREGVWDQGQRRYGLEELLYTYGVDFYFAGHQHNYERIFDVYKGDTTFSYNNMPATVYILIGAAGAKHGLNDFKPDHECAAWSDVRLLCYGYSRFYIYNRTHVKLQYVMADATITAHLDDDIYETVWYVQEEHGPFSNRIKDNNNNITRSINKEKTETVNLYKKYGYKTPKTIFDPLEVIPYHGSNKEDYMGIDGVFF